jgi:hypothetical protein
MPGCRVKVGKDHVTAAGEIRRGQLALSAPGRLPEPRPVLIVQAYLVGGAALEEFIEGELRFLDGPQEKPAVDDLDFQAFTDLALDLLQERPLQADRCAVAPFLDCQSHDGDLSMSVAMKLRPGEIGVNIVYTSKPVHPVFVTLALPSASL